MEKINILIVDDIKDNLFALRYLLEENFDSINILEATNVKDALILIMKNDIDLILSDVQMPEIDGYQFVEYLQGIEATKDIPVILITGIYNNEVYQKKAYSASKEVVDFITKPIDEDVLCSKLNVFIKLFKERKVNRKALEEKEQELAKQKKIGSMFERLDNQYVDIKYAILESEAFKDVLLDDESFIDLEEICKSNKCKR